jgi:hypothetical protein
MKKIFTLFLFISSSFCLYGWEDLLKLYEESKDFQAEAQFAYEAQFTIAEFKYPKFFIRLYNHQIDSPMYYLYKDYIENVKTNIDKYQFFKHYPKIYNY